MGWRTRIKTCVEGLPFGLGTRGIIPLIRLTRDMLVDRKPTDILKKKRIAKRAAMKISSAMAAGVKKAAVVFDTSCSPPTYGDYLLVVLLARYLKARGLDPDFYIVNSEFRKDWNDLAPERRIALVGEQFEIARVLLGHSGAPRIRTLSWSEFEKIASGWSRDEVLLPFAENVFERAPIYQNCFNVLNYLLADAEDAVLSRTLFACEQMRPLVSFTPPPPPYITWHIRYNDKWALDRNTAADEFSRIHAALRRRFPRHAIMIVSDATGCGNFRKLAASLGIELLFSKDFSDSFLGDAALILNSEYYFQLRGGGIGVFPVFSLMPYTRVGYMSNEVKWTWHRATSWQTESQVFRASDARFRESMIPRNLNRDRQYG